MQLKTEYEQRLQRHNYTYNMYAAFTYDAVWSIALMLNKSIPLLREKNKTLENMSYRDKEAAKIMRDTLFRTDFWGMSVCIYVMFTTPVLGNCTLFLACFDGYANINVQWQRVSRRKVSLKYGALCGERVTLQFMCVGSWDGVTYLRYTVLMSPKKDETAVHCWIPLYRFSLSCWCLETSFT